MAIGNPVARSTPICRSRCFDAETEEQDRKQERGHHEKKLKYVKYSPKSVAPAEAASAWVRTGSDGYAERFWTHGSAQLFAQPVGNDVRLRAWRHHEAQRCRGAVTRRQSSRPRS